LDLTCNSRNCFVVLREEALATGLVGAAEFDALVRPEAMLAPDD
jgi:fumarate hydratase class II